MTVRMKEAYFLAKKYNPTKEVLQGCQLHDQRKALNALQATAASQEQWRKAKAAFDVEARTVKGRNAPVILKMKVKHGDMVVMHGEKLQKYFEVCF